MPTIDWLKNEFNYGYDSGDILESSPSPERLEEESRAGGSYRELFLRGCFPYLMPDSKVMELGPGRGAWSRAILNFLPQGSLHTVDFQDVTAWLKPVEFQGRLVCHQVQDNSFACVPDDYFDVFWSFGVLCHQNTEHIREILANALFKMKKGGVAIHEYADWNKLTSYGWERGGVPAEFQSLPDDKIWWPRNNQQIMSQIAIDAGWIVIEPDLNLIQRDSVIILKKW